MHALQRILDNQIRVVKNMGNAPKLAFMHEKDSSWITAGFWVVYVII